MNLQIFFDNLIEKMFLWAFPKKIKPNSITYFRFITTPIVFWLFYTDNYFWAILSFVICVSTDFIDGAMARKRNQVTELGKIIDPLADKFLIGSVLLAIGYQYFIVKLIIGFIFLELLTVLVAFKIKNIIGKSEGANAFGKIKMVFQSFGIFILLFGIIYKNQAFITLAGWVLGISFIFAVVSAYEQFRDRLIFINSKK